MISIIIPVYRVEKFIRRCLDSILSQTYKDWECILVNDGSPDNSGTICDEYAQKDNRFKVIHKKNGGVSSARNSGLAIATGEWIAFVDSDDYVSQEWLSSVVKFINRNTQADCFEWGHFIGRNGSAAFKQIVPSGNIYTSNSKFLCSTDYKHVSWCYLYRYDFIKNHNCSFPSGIRSGEDQCFILEYLAHVSQIVTIPEAFYYYVDNPDSAVNTLKTLDDTEDALKVALCFSEFCQKEGIEQTDYQRYAIMSLFYIYLFLIYDRHFTFSMKAQKIYRDYYHRILKVQPSMRYDTKLRLAYLCIGLYSFYLYIARLKSHLLKGN